MSSSCAWCKLFGIRRLIFHIGNPNVGRFHDPNYRLFCESLHHMKSKPSRISFFSPYQEKCNEIHCGARVFGLRNWSKYTNDVFFRFKTLLKSDFEDASQWYCRVAC